MTPSEPRQERKVYTRESIVLLPVCPRCKRQDNHHHDCQHDGTVTGVYKRVDTFIRFDSSPLPPVSTIRFSFSSAPTNWQASPNGDTIKYSDSLKKAGDDWMYLKMMVEGTGR